MSTDVYLSGNIFFLPAISFKLKAEKIICVERKAVVNFNSSTANLYLGYVRTLIK